MPGGDAEHESHAPADPAVFSADPEVGRDLARGRLGGDPARPTRDMAAEPADGGRASCCRRGSPMWMAWGPELTFFCNAAYRRDTLGRKYPWALGRPASEVWAEIWDDIGPRIETVLSTGEATWDAALLLFLERSGYPEETYHTFSYSPLRDDDGADRRHALRGQRGHPAGDRRAADGDAAGPGVRSRAWCATEEEMLTFADRQLGQNLRDLPVHADLPVRRGRRRAAGAAERDRRRTPAGARSRSRPRPDRVAGRRAAARASRCSSISTATRSRSCRPETGRSRRRRRWSSRCCSRAARPTDSWWPR